MLAVGNLSCSLHGIRSRHPSWTPSALAAPPSQRLDTTDAAATTTTSSFSSSCCGGSEPPMLGPAAAAASLVSPGELVPRPRLRSLCSGALRLTATEPDHAAGSAVRALGYLAWGLDPANNGGAGGRRGGGDSDGGLGETGRECANSVPLATSGRGGEAGAAAAAAVGAARGPVCQEDCTRGDDGEDEEDRGLQDKTVLALSTRLALEKESLSPGVGNGGVRGSGGDRRAEIAAAKCR